MLATGLNHHWQEGRLKLGGPFRSIFLLGKGQRLRVHHLFGGSRRRLSVLKDLRNQGFRFEPQSAVRSSHCHLAREPDLGYSTKGPTDPLHYRRERRRGGE